MSGRALLVLASAFLHVMSHGAQEAPKVPIPAPAELKAPAAEIRDLFKEDYARRDPAGRSALAAKLLAAGIKSPGDPPSCYVFLTEARDLAAQGGDLTTAIDAIDQLDRIFDLSSLGKDGNPRRMKLDVLKALQRSARKVEQVFPIAEQYYELARLSAEAEDFDTAQSAAKTAHSLARKIREKKLTDLTSELSKDIPELSREYEAASSETLAKPIEPGNHRVNMAVGRYLCFAKGEWDKGLKYLAAGGNKTLADLAAKELSKPTDSSACFELGEGWFELSKKERSPLHVKRYRGRARYWYTKAQAGADGLIAVKIGKRLEDLGPSIATRMLAANPTLVGAWRFDQIKGDTVPDDSSHDNAGRLVGNPAKSGGSKGGALTFDAAANSYVEIPHHESQNSYPLTISVWIKTASRRVGGVVNKYVNTSNNGYQIFMREGSVYAYYFRSGLNNVYIKGSGLNGGLVNDDAWHHVAFVVDANGGALYVDGEVKDQKAWLGSPGPCTTKAPLKLGVFPGPPADAFYHGSIDDVQIYKSALSGSQIRALAP